MSLLTKKALAEALKKLMQTSTLAKITVNDVVEECGVTRRTLYYHFHDLYDLLEWIYMTETKEVLGDNRTYRTWETGFLALMLYLKANKKMVMNTYHSVERDILENHLYNEIFKLIYSVVEELAKGLGLADGDKKYVAKIYKILFTGIILDWIKNDMDEEPDELARNVDQIVKGEIYRALLKYMNEEEQVSCEKKEA